MLKNQSWWCACNADLGEAETGGVLGLARRTAYHIWLIANERFGLKITPEVWYPNVPSGLCMYLQVHTHTLFFT